MEFPLNKCCFVFLAIYLVFGHYTECSANSLKSGLILSEKNDHNREISAPSSNSDHYSHGDILVLHAKRDSKENFPYNKGLVNAIPFGQLLLPVYSAIIYSQYLFYRSGNLLRLFPFHSFW